MDASEQTSLPFYMYKLQWWWFIPSKPLIKVIRPIIKNKCVSGNVSENFRWDRRRYFLKNKISGKNIV